MCEMKSITIGPGYLIDINRCGCGASLSFSIYAHCGCTYSVDPSQLGITFSWHHRNAYHILSHVLNLWGICEPDCAGPAMNYGLYLVEESNLIDWLETYIESEVESKVLEVRSDTVRDTVMDDFYGIVRGLAKQIRSARLNHAPPEYEEAVSALDPATLPFYPRDLSLN